MSFQIIRGNALALPLEDASVDLVVTSPPYFGLRSYQDAGEHYTGQLGSEATPAEFVDALLAATAEMVRVLKPSGSIWVNLGDKYSSGGRGSYDPDTSARRQVSTLRPGDDAKPKSLLGIPWRYALRCIDDLGLILRAEIIWSKPNGLPESVTDRVRRSHEQWFHFTVRPRYYSAVDEIREAYDTADRPGTRSSYKPGQTSGNTLNGHVGKSDAGLPLNPLGKLPGSVWTIPTQPLTVPPELGVDHFAAFPMEWPRRIIRGWSPLGVCVKCGEGRRPATDKHHVVEDTYPDGEVPGLNNRHLTEARGRRSVVASITGYVCGCPFAWPAEKPDHSTIPAVVLDPFGGTGTTALVAHALGRHGISVDMSADYCRLAEWRCNDRGQLAAAMQVDKPEPVPEDQLDLFGGVA